MITRITAIEDDPDILNLLRFNLEQAGYRVSAHRDGAAGLAALQQEPPDLAILDLMLPGLDGLEILRRLRSAPRTENVPVIIVSVRDREPDIVLGLGLGADDYLTKPFGISELEARVKSVLRRYDGGKRKSAQAVVRAGELLVDMDSFTATLGAETLVLTPTEFRMLHALAGNPGRVYTRQMLMDAAISDEVIVMDHNIDVHIAALRKKLGPARNMIETVWGVGYRFSQPEVQHSLPEAGYGEEGS